MSSDRTQINIAVNPERKEKWQDYVEENNEASNLSHLIRLSVEREIERDEPPTGQGGADVDLSGIDERFDELQVRIEDLARSVDRIAKQDEHEEIEDLAGKIYDAIPEIEDEDEWLERLESGDTQEIIAFEETTEKDLSKHYPEHDNIEFVSEWYVTFSALARKFEVSEYRTRLAAEEVEESFSRVKTHHHEGDTYIYEVVRNGD